MSDLSHSEYAAAARAKKRAEAESVGINADYISLMVEEFYASIRSDAMLGPIFDERIDDWPKHLGRMKSFWRSVLHNSGEYAGNPMQKHLAIPGLEFEHFERWLELFFDNLRNIERHPAASEEVGARARNIANSLLLSRTTKSDGLNGINAGKDLPHVS
jgi:hemoglobin